MKTIEEALKLSADSEIINEEMKIAFDRVYTFLIEILSDGKVEYSDTINVACVGREDAEAILDRMIGENEYKIKDTLVFDNIINYLLNHNKNTIYNLSDVEKHYGSLEEELKDKVEEKVAPLDKFERFRLQELIQKYGRPDEQFNEDANEEKNSDKGAEDEHVKPEGLMIWTKENANDYHADWIEVPADITLEQFKELLISNSYEIHDYSEEDKGWWGDDAGVKFCIELGTAARWWRFSSLEGCMKWFKAGNANTFKNSGTDDILDEDADYTLTEKYSEEELDKMVGKVYNIQKIDNIFKRKKYGDKKLFAHTICTKCGREKTVFLSNIVTNPAKYGSCICSDTNIDAKIDNIEDLYKGRKKLSSNTSGYTGVSFVKTYKGEPYNKWRAYIEVDGVRTYLGDFTSKAKAIKARKEAGEKGIKWYKDNRNKLMRDVRRRSKKYKTSKYRETQKARSYKKAK